VLVGSVALTVCGCRLVARTDSTGMDDIALPLIDCSEAEDEDEVEEVDDVDDVLDVESRLADACRE